MPVILHRYTLADICLGFELTSMRVDATISSVFNDERCFTNLKSSFSIYPGEPWLCPIVSRAAQR